jgi:hypothetical protein
VFGVATFREGTRCTSRCDGSRAMGPYLKTNPWIWVIGVFAVLIVIGALTG